MATALLPRRPRRLGEEEESPLDHPKILTKILNYCNSDLAELKSIRLVGRLWHEVTLDKWRSLATLKLIKDVPEPPEVCTSATLDDPLYQNFEESGVPMSEFLSCIVDPSDPYDLDTKPFQRVKVKGIDIEQEMEFTGCNSEVINVFPRVWDLIGAFVTYLHFDECMFENTLKMGAFQKVVLEKTPFLQQLVMTNTIVVEPSWEQNKDLIIRYDSHLTLTSLHIIGDFPMGLIHFLPYIPQIEELYIRHGTTIVSQGRHYFHSTWVPISNLRKIRKDNFNIKRFDVMHTDVFKINFNPTNQFRATSLPLEQFSVEVSPYLDLSSVTPPQPSSSRGVSRLRSTEDILAPMMREHVNTLKGFKVFRPPFSEPYNHFPFGITIEGLQELHLWGNVTTTFSFLKCFPNLEKLTIDTICFEKWGEMKEFFEMEQPFEFQPFREDIVRFTTCSYTQFRIKMGAMRELYIELALQPESVAQLAEWMPNLKSFKTVLDKVTFRVVCCTMPQLEELGALFGSEIDNETITGVAPGIPKDPYNIRSFPKLKRFTLAAYCGRGLLKDSAVYLGFLKVNLYQLEICVSRQMSPEAEEELRAVVPVFRFIRNYGPEPHGGYECCKRSKFARDVLRRLPPPSHLTAADRFFHL